MSSLHQKISHFLHEDPLIRRVLKNTGYLFSSSTLSIVFVAVQSFLSARLLGTDGFGLIALIITFATTINNVFSFRMGDFVVRFFSKAKADGDLPRAAAVIKASALIESSTSIIAFCFLFLIAPFAAKYLSKVYDPLYTSSLFRLFGVVILMNFATETANGVLRVTNHYKSQAVITLLQSIITFSLITIAYLFKWGIEDVLFAYLIGKIFIGVSPIIVAKRVMSREFGSDWWQNKLSILPSIKEMFRFAISTNLSATIKQLASESEPLWLGLFLNESAVGLYKVAMAIVTLVTIPITPFIQTSFPEITMSVVTKKWAQLRKLLRKITLVAAIWTIPASLFLVFFGKWFIRILYESPYLPAYPAMLILLLGFGFSNIYFWNRSLLLSFGKANVPLYILAASGVLKMGLAFLLVPVFGIEGEAALLSAYFILSTGILVIIGYSMIHKAENHEIASGLP